MKIISEKDLFLIEGGINISGTLINSITGLAKLIFDIGKSVGTSIRRTRENKFCKL